MTKDHPDFQRIYHIRDGVTHEEAGEGRMFEEIVSLETGNLRNGSEHTKSTLSTQQTA